MANEPDLDPGPPVHAGVAFVEIAHVKTGGRNFVHPDLLEHHRQRGWALVDSPASSARTRKPVTVKPSPSAHAQEA